MRCWWWAAEKAIATEDTEKEPHPAVRLLRDTEIMPNAVPETQSVFLCDLCVLRGLIDFHFVV